MSPERNCLSYWFPRLQAAGVPVPRTEIVRTKCELVSLLDGQTPDGFEAFLDEIEEAALRIGPGPWFLRTGHGSGKHQWKHTCCLKDLDALPYHVCALVEWAECAGMLGLPYDVWVVREMLPVKPIAILPHYGDMPLVREVRAFVRDGTIVCWHPYWPQGSIEEGLPRISNLGMNDEGEHGDKVAVRRRLAAEYFEAANVGMLGSWLRLVNQVAAAFANDGAWSVDVLETDRGWYVTDMALAGESFHWEGCPNAKEFQREPL